jgi:hypothetical protein
VDVFKSFLLLSIGSLEGAPWRNRLKGDLLWVRGVLAVEHAERYLLQYLYRCKVITTKSVKSDLIKALMSLRDDGFVDMYDEVGPDTTTTKTHGYQGCPRRRGKPVHAPTQDTMVRLTSAKGAAFYQIYADAIRGTIN